MDISVVNTILKQEAYDSYRFLIDHTNFDETSSGYGLTLDRTSNKVSSSIAGSGFMLSGLVIGVEQKWDKYEVNLKRALLTLKNFFETIPHFEGMFVHYAEYLTGKRYKKCEFSTIDTALFLNGMLTVDAYFNDKEISDYSKKIIERINWEKFIFQLNGRNVFRMAYNDIRGGDYLKGTESGWIHHWNMFAEQISLYLLASTNEGICPKLCKELYLGFDRSVGGYQGHQFVFTPLGALFTHLYSHAWFDFKSYNDLNGFNWFINSINAIYANYLYCQDLKPKYKTFQEDFWGLSACDGPKGYCGYGAPPFITYNHIHEGKNTRLDGTVALYAIFGSLPFAPDLVKDTVFKMNEKYSILKGPYGFYDSINLENGLWIGFDYISIDKGITLLMIDNYYNQTTWKYYTNHPFIQKAIEKLAFVKKEV